MAAPMSTLPPPYTPSREPQREEWEDWEDDEIHTPIDASEQVVDVPPRSSVHSTRYSRPIRPRSSRLSGAKIKRLKSRHRQKAQNAKAGIKLITDMSAFRRDTHILRNPDGRPAKFVDAAALRALEGEPNSASVGNWNWFKKSKAPSPTTRSPKPPPARSGTQQLSPEDRPIVIGISLPSEDADGREIIPQTAYIETPAVAKGPQQLKISPNQVGEPGQMQQKSVWSPDTPDTASSFTSSIYSAMPGSGPATGSDVPPVPAVPDNFKKAPHKRLMSMELRGSPADEDDSGTPCTLFEEDGISAPQKSGKAASSSLTPEGAAPGLAHGWLTPDSAVAAKSHGWLTPDSAASKSHGWWDHIVTPFMDKHLTFSSTRKQRLDSPTSAQQEDWPTSPPETKPAYSQYLTPQLPSGTFQTPIVRAPTPRRTPSPRPEAEVATAIPAPEPARSASPAHDEEPIISEKPQIIVSPAVSSEHPPPYSPPEKKGGDMPVRYRAVFPPGHPLHSQFPPSPSPGPESPGLAATMTSQGGREMTEIPLTPAPRTNIPLSQMAMPNRPLGTSLPQEHFLAESGRTTAAERRRQRHEKEDAIARRAGGFWRGRGCIPEKGCFGRTGREGRKRRRVCMLIVGIIIALLILIITLAVVLTRPRHTKDTASIWVNLTDFPPMPTGVLTIVGPDNTVAKSGCSSPSTLWSCSLPKDQQSSVAPYHADQPTIVLNTQYDNGTEKTWKKTDGDTSKGPSRRSIGVFARARAFIRERRQVEKFKPEPSPPSLKEMWFLGNTTDDIKSSNKAGEPTPFYISLVGTDAISKAKQLDERTITTAAEANISLTKVLPRPSLNHDGTPKPAVLLPEPVQQPVRLYDRGRPTEHYGFYTYFSRTLFLKSVAAPNKTESEEGNVPTDEDGGCRETEADFLTTWSQTRLLVQIWTRTLEANTSALASSEGQPSIKGSAGLIRPGTMPYPVTVTLDTHGGDPEKKFVWALPMDDRQQVDENDAQLLANNIGAGGDWVNARFRGIDSLGGFDGGDGGCQCQWANWDHVKQA